MSLFGSDLDPASVDLQRQETLYTSSNATRRWLHTSRRDWVVRALSELTARGKEAAEVGPGSGIYLPVLLSLFPQVTAFDVESEYLEAAAAIAANTTRLSVVQGDITDPKSLPASKFDLVLCSEVIEHIRPERTQQAFDSLNRLLVPGGYLILTTPHRNSVLERVARVALTPPLLGVVQRFYDEPVGILGHSNLMSASEVQTALKKADLQILRSDSMGLYMPGIAEFLGTAGQRLAATLEPLIRKSRLRELLWTQLYVARKPA